MKTAKKVVGVAGIALICANLALFSFRVYSEIAFWIVLGSVAAASFILLRILK